MIDFKYIPDSYNYNILKNNKIDKNKFLKLQIKYRTEFERLLINIVDFKKIDDYIDNFKFDIPVVDDFDYNFYHKFSTLGSKYIYLRNNIHIENLSFDEINIIDNSLKDNAYLDYNFLRATFKKVLYEDGEFSMFGIPLEKNLVFAKSLVFEFAYDQAEFKDVSQYNFVNDIINTIHTSLENSIEKVIDTKISIISYNAIPDIYID